MKQGKDLSFSVDHCGVVVLGCLCTFGCTMIRNEPRIFFQSYTHVHPSGLCDSFLCSCDIFVSTGVPLLITYAKGGFSIENAGSVVMREFAGATP